MTALFWDGYDDQRPVAEFVNDSVRCGNASGGRGSGRRLEVNGAYADFHERGHPVTIAESGADLWVGTYFDMVFSQVGNAMRFLVIKIGGTSVVAVGKEQVGVPADLYLWLSPDTSAITTTSPDHTVSDAWDTIAKHVVVHIERRSTNGDVTVYLNGEETIKVTDVAALAEAGDFTEVLFTARTDSTSNQAGWLFYHDDVWVGTQNYGDARVPTLLATSQGFHTDGTPSTGTDNFALVNDAPPDDATYVTLDTDGAKDSYIFDGSGLSAEDRVGVAGVRAQLRSAGSGTLAPFVRDGSTDYVVTGHGVTGDASQNDDLLTVNPATSAAFTFADFDSLELGALFSL